MIRCDGYRETQEAMSAKFAVLLEDRHEREGRRSGGVVARSWGHGGIEAGAGGEGGAWQMLGGGRGKRRGAGGRARGRGGGGGRRPRPASEGRCARRSGGWWPPAAEATRRCGGGRRSPATWPLGAERSRKGEPWRLDRQARRREEVHVAGQGHARRGLPSPRPDRDAQVRYIDGQGRDLLWTGEELSGEDTKKKNVVDFLKNGRE